MSEPRTFAELHPDTPFHCAVCGRELPPSGICPGDNHFPVIAEMNATRDRLPEDVALPDLVVEVQELRDAVVKLAQQQESWQTHALAIVAEVRPYLDQAMPMIEKISSLLTPFSRMHDAVGSTRRNRRNG